MKAALDRFEFPSKVSRTCAVSGVPLQLKPCDASAADRRTQHSALGAEESSTYQPLLSLPQLCEGCPVFQRSLVLVTTAQDRYSGSHTASLTVSPSFSNLNPTYSRYNYCREKIKVINSSFAEQGQDLFISYSFVFNMRE